MNGDRVTNRDLRDAIAAMKHEIADELADVKGKVELIHGCAIDNERDIAVLQKNGENVKQRLNSTDQRVGVLETREREGAIERAKTIAMSSLIGAAVAALPQIIAALR